MKTRRRYAPPFFRYSRKTGGGVQTPPPSRARVKRNVCIWHLCANFCCFVVLSGNETITPLSVCLIVPTCMHALTNVVSNIDHDCLSYVQPYDSLAVPGGGRLDAPPPAFFADSGKTVVRKNDRATVFLAHLFNINSARCVKNKRSWVISGHVTRQGHVARPIKTFDFIPNVFKLSHVHKAIRTCKSRIRFFPYWCP